MGERIGGPVDACGEVDPIVPAVLQLCRIKISAVIAHHIPTKHATPSAITIIART